MNDSTAGVVLLVLVVLVLNGVLVRRKLQHIGRSIENALLQAVYDLFFARKRTAKGK